MCCKKYLKDFCTTFQTELMNLPQTSMPVSQTASEKPSVFYSASDIAWHTEAGRRANNEDSCAFQIAPDGCAALLVVADGMGGHASGEVASRLAVDRLLEACARDGFQVSPAGFSQTLQNIHDEILQTAAKKNELHGMGTTLVAALLRSQSVLVGHVGDSRALQFRGTLVRRLTRDHLYVVDALNIPENRAKEHPQGHMLSQALGAAGTITPDVEQFEVQAGDLILLCTDGVGESVPEPQMHAVLQGEDLSSCAAVLVRRALENGSRDNCTVALARIPAPSVAGTKRLDAIGDLKEAVFQKTVSPTETRDEETS